MPEIILQHVTKRFDKFVAVQDLDLQIQDRGFITLLGPSGCGKTTTLRMIAGLETPTSGRITIDGVPVFDSQRGINVSANKRKVGFLFQNYALWPNMTVYQNISFGLTNIKEEMDEIDFDARGEWTDVERPGGVVPDGLIPQPILKFVAANYPGRHVRGVERDGRNHEITLDNGLELKFNRRFRLVETDH